MRSSRSITAPKNHPSFTLNSARPRSHRYMISSVPTLIDEKVEPSKTVLQKVRNRLKPEKNSANPTLAVEVVRNYILPMFEYENRTRQNTQRSENFGHNRNFSTERGTVYSELKLSERLGKEMDSLELKLAQMKQTVHDSMQETFKVTKENQELVENLSNAQSNILFLREENLKLQRDNIGIKFSIGVTLLQLGKYKKLFEEANQENGKLSKQLQEEKASNDIRL